MDELAKAGYVLPYSPVMAVRYLTTNYLDQDPGSDGSGGCGFGELFSRFQSTASIAIAFAAAVAFRALGSDGRTFPSHCAAAFG